MKNFFKVFLLATLVSTSLYAEVRISRNKINGPECTKHLMKALSLKAEDAYQICSAHSEEVKICLIQNSKLPKDQLIKKCHKK